ncbi:Septin-type guanine nucleotide-binding (G) domain-containing protein [Phlyctochytrium arcticum]|nr:Septin-type guanine nucleotide-binding (G) domain-containing protein [Phlyctochytrium arcticum]
MTSAKTTRGPRARRVNVHQFNLMVAGHCFTGKSAFLRTLFESLDISALVPDGPNDVNEQPIPTSQNNILSILPPDDIHVPTASTGRIEFCIDEDNPSERIALRVIDTTGVPVPHNIHREQQPEKSDEHINSARPQIATLVQFLEAQFEATLLEESKVRRNAKSLDYQIHACLYFLDPQVCFACRGITAIDRFALEQLCSRANVIVCLAKADLLTVRHLRTLRNLVVEDLARFAIPVFAFPEDPDIEYEKEAIELNEELRNMLPFAIVNMEEGEEDPVRRDDDLIAPRVEEEPEPKVLGRQYPWGVVEVENPQHCDFVRVKETLFTTHLHELKLLTRELYYEQWRTEKLLEVRNSVLGSSVVSGGASRRDSFAPSTTSMDTVKLRNMEQEIADELRSVKLQSGGV